MENNNIPLSPGLVLVLSEVIGQHVYFFDFPYLKTLSRMYFFDSAVILLKCFCLRKYFTDIILVFVVVLSIFVTDNRSLSCFESHREALRLDYGPYICSVLDFYICAMLDPNILL